MKPSHPAPRHRRALALAGLAALSALSASALAAAPSVAGDAAAFKAFMPPPGLYKVEINGKEKDTAMSGLAYLRQSHIDADSGALTQRFQDRAGKSASVQHAGQGPATVCFTAHKLATSPFPANCKAESSGIVNGEWHGASQCDGNHIAVAVRKTAPTTWEYRTTILTAGVVAGPGSATGMAGMPRGFLQNLAQKGPTAEIRAEAARALAEQSANPAGAAAPAAPGAMRQEITSVQTLTRIADACPAGAH